MLIGLFDLSIFSKNPTTDSLQRTTTAVTMFNGGLKENVMPQYAEFVVNHRIHSSQTCVEVSPLLPSSIIIRTFAYIFQRFIDVSCLKDNRS